MEFFYELRILEHREKQEKRSEKDAARTSSIGSNSLKSAQCTVIAMGITVNNRVQSAPK